MPGIKQSFAAFVSGVSDAVPGLRKLNPFARGSMGGPLDLWNAEQMKKLKSALNPGVGRRGLMDNWWEGRTFMGMGADGAGMYSDVDRGAKFIRRGAVSGLGALAAMNIMDVDPLYARTIGNEGLNLAKHATVAGTAWKMGGGWKAAGLGYLAWGGINRMRGSEDHLGPY